MDAKTKQSVVLLLFLCLHLKTHVCLAADTIAANQSLSGDQTIVSAGKVFELGFFKPGNSSNYYIGMWYSKQLVTSETIVWVANRETSVSDRFSSVLRISDGNLVLFNESNIPIWSTNLSSTTTSGSARAVLLDSGNLVLRTAGSNANTSEPLWQSFDHPAHTWLPGAKIGFNTVTNQTLILTSWKSSEDPAPGLFTLELDPNGSNACRLLWNRSRQYWSSGAWDANSRTFSGIPEMNRNYIYNFSLVKNKNKNESYFTYSTYDPQIISRFGVHTSGQIQKLSWLENSSKSNFFWSKPGKLCEVYDLCGAFGSCNEESTVSCNCLTGFEPKWQRDWNLQAYSGGCKRKTPLHCENATMSDGKQDQFLKMARMSLPENEQSVKVETFAGCESICLNNCSCTAYAYNSSGCSIWIGELFNLQQLTSSDNQGITLNIRLAASEFKSPKSNKGLIVGVVAGSAAGIAILLGLIVVVILRQRNRVTGTGKAVEVRFFPSWAASQISTAETDVLSLLDPRLDGNADVQELTRICRVACWCVQDDEAHRPSMGQVVQILEGVSDVNLPPIPRSLQVLGDDQEHIIFFTESSSRQSSHQRSNNTSTASFQTKSTTSSTISKRSEEEHQINT
ncbi:G-type lectin S-receptor-like serine/threonine-protein kinase [Prunus yedoensis var. nudiflora]|uniref:G-type lectin S-receptor-like serine/threonine-protein kinase n=1 Tax=Prunus yedoensis var. nudiflora TaxID=2094558 RepID=A0A314YXT4_PRUYE|nr:G-type lectin S-receptor-like serine/threonine-protein kinase [Prunus yedoensis var. nudiflora]